MGMGYHEENLVQSYHLVCVHLKSDLIRGLAIDGRGLLRGGTTVFIFIIDYGGPIVNLLSSFDIVIIQLQF